MGTKEIQEGLRKLHERIRNGKEVSEEDVRVAFVRSGILEELGYAGDFISKSDVITEEILRKLNEDKAQAISPSVAELEHDINELVYQLYGLNADDIKVIEDFLQRF